MIDNQFLPFTIAMGFCLVLLIVSLWTVPAMRFAILTMAFVISIGILVFLVSLKLAGIM